MSVEDVNGLKANGWGTNLTGAVVVFADYAGHSWDDVLDHKSRYRVEDVLHLKNTSITGVVMWEAQNRQGEVAQPTT